MITTGENRNTPKKKMPHCQFVQQKTWMDWPEIEPGPTRQKAGDNPPALKL